MSTTHAGRSRRTASSIDAVVRATHLDEREREVSGKLVR